MNDSRLVFVGPSSTVARANMTVKRSDSGGDTFRKAVVIYPGPSAYSSLTALYGADEVGLLFEHGSSGGDGNVGGSDSSSSSGSSSKYGSSSLDSSNGSGSGSSGSSSKDGSSSLGGGGQSAYGSLSFARVPMAF